MNEAGVHQVPEKRKARVLLVKGRGSVMEAGLRVAPPDVACTHHGPMGSTLSMWKVYRYT